MSKNSTARLVPSKKYGHAPQDEHVPLAFGANFHDDPITRSTLRKSQTLQLANKCDHDPHTSYTFAGTKDSDLLFSTHTKSSSAYGSTFAGTSAAIPQVDESILRFLAYTEEAVPESPDESVRVRKLSIVYHCADGTIAVREANQVNSGMSQGPFLKRQRVPLPNGSGTLGLNELGIGETVSIFGRPMTIIDMDEFSRKYFRETLGREVPELGLPWPSNDTYNQRISRKMKVETKKRIPSTDMDHKRAIESLNSGGIVSKHAPDDIRIAQQFFANNINEHLQYAVLWDERDKMSGDVRTGVLKYYLENDQIEIVEKRDSNSGREGSSKVLCRQRAPNPNIEDAQSAAQQQHTYGMLHKRTFLTFPDLQIGAELNLYGIKYLVFDADAFTRKWVKEKSGIELAPAKDVRPILLRDFKEPPKQYPPAHNGFGSEEDSLRNWKSLLLNQGSIKRSAKEVAEEGKVMVFSAVIHRVAQPEDEGREFIIKYFRATEEIEVTERQLRNSGIMGGKILAKGRHLKLLPDGRKVPYQPEDFQEGDTMLLNGRTYLLTELDAKSKKQIAGVVEPVTEDRIRELVVLLRELLQSKYYRLSEGWRKLAPEGALTVTEVHKFFHQCAAPVTDEESLQVVRHFERGTNGGRLTYEHFAKMMGIPKVMTMDDFSNNPKTIKNVDVSPVDSSYRTATATAADASLRIRLKKTLIAKLVQRRGTVQEVFRLMAGHASNARLSRQELRNSLTEILHFRVSPKEEDILIDVVFEGYGPTEELDFKAFHEFIESA